MKLRRRIPAVAFLCSLLLTWSCKRTPPDPNVMNLTVQGTVDVNGTPVVVEAKGTLNTQTGAYEFKRSGVVDASHPRDALLATLIPRAALAFLRVGDHQAIADASGGKVEIALEGHRKIDNVSRLSGKVALTKETAGATIRLAEAVVITPAGGDRAIESDGEMVMRLGVNPAKGNFVGVARINYDLKQPDPASLGTADFWNIEGRFAPVQTTAFAHVDRGAGNVTEGLAKGLALSFASSTVFEPGILTLSGVAAKDGVIYQFKGIANQAGGGRTLFTFPVRIRKGMTGADVARLIQQGFTTAREKKVDPQAEFVLAVQGGDGVSITQQDPASSRVAISMTLDGGRTIANRTDARANAIFDVAATQSFSDQGVSAAENTGIRNQFGVVGQAGLNGWLTPFKVVFNTDNAATGNMAGGGEVRVLLNWTERTGAGGTAAGSTTKFEDLVVPTKKGDTADQIVARVAEALRDRKTEWESTAFTQRSGNVLYIDAGIDFPHSVSLASTDPGVGYMSAAADLPAFANVRK